MEDWSCLGKHKRQPEFPVVTRESRRNSRKTTGSILSDDYFNILYNPESPETLTYRFDQISMNVGGKVGVVNTDIPSRIEIYPVSFEQREDVIAMIMGRLGMDNPTQNRLRKKRKRNDCSCTKESEVPFRHRGIQV